MTNAPAQRTRAVRLLDAVETIVLVLLVTALLLVGLAQLVMRNVFHTGVLWFEPLSRYLVLWIAFAGALRAAREDRHIRIDLIPRLVAGRLGALTMGLTSLAAAILCALLARSGFLFLQSEREFGAVAFLSVPTWITLAAIPVGFSLIGIRMATVAIVKLTRFVNPR